MSGKHDIVFTIKRSKLYGWFNLFDLIVTFSILLFLNYLHVILF